MIRRFIGKLSPEARNDENAVRKFGLLRASDLFHELNEEQMGDVERMTVMTSCERGRLVYTPGETAEALFLLKQGKVRIYRITCEAFPGFAANIYLLLEAGPPTIVDAGSG